MWMSRDMYVPWVGGGTLWFAALAWWAMWKGACPLQTNFEPSARVTGRVHTHPFKYKKLLSQHINSLISGHLGSYWGSREQGATYVYAHVGPRDVWHILHWSIYINSLISGHFCSTYPLLREQGATYVYNHFIASFPGRFFSKVTLGRLLGLVFIVSGCGYRYRKMHRKTCRKTTDWMSYTRNL